MTVRLEPQTWARLHALATSQRPASRGPSAIRWLTPYWVLALAVAWAIHADIISVRPALLALAPPPGIEASPPHDLRPGAARSPALLAVGQSDGQRLGSGSAWIGVAVLESAFSAGAFAEPFEMADQSETDPQAASAEPAERIASITPAARRRLHRASRERPARTAHGTARRPTRSRRSRPVAPAATPRARGAALRDRRVAPAPRPARPAPAVGGKVQSCEAAVAAYREQVSIGGGRGPADLTAGQYGAVLNRGSYFSHCGVPASMGISICAAVQRGRAAGVTVTTTPRSSRIQRCVAGAVRGLAFPSHPRLDVTTTTFAPAR